MRAALLVVVALLLSRSAVAAPVLATAAHDSYSSLPTLVEESARPNATHPRDNAFSIGALMVSRATAHEHAALVHATGDTTVSAVSEHSLSVGGALLSFVAVLSLLVRRRIGAR